VDIANGGEEYTFSRIYEETCKCASALYKKGIRRGDVVGILCPNSCQQKILVLALALCGATIVPINYYYTEDRYLPDIFIYILKQTKLFRFTCSDQMKKKTLLMNFWRSVQMKVQSSGVAYINYQYPQFFVDDPMHYSLVGVPDVEIDIHNDDLFLLSSSGTTGPPKLTQLTNYGVVAILQRAYYTDLCHITVYPPPDNVVYSLTQTFHGGSIAFVFTHLIQGCAHVIPSEYNRDQLLQAIKKYNVSHLNIYASVLLDLVKSADVQKGDFGGIVEIATGAATTLEEVKLLVKSKLGVQRLIESYGLTEALPVTSFDSTLSKLGSVGFLLPNVNLKVVEIETRKTLNANEKGEILVKGPQVNMAKGYYKNPEATKKMFDGDGWLKTGDIGYFDENGNIYITDRLKDVIKIAGVQFHLLKLKPFSSNILKLPIVGVVGVSDDVGCNGEVPKAFVVKNDPSLTADEVNRFVQDKLAAFKQLRGGVTFMDELPKSGSGKVLKRILRLEIMENQLK
uniref:AMP-dependent synthetase/ligase domain-containing protein n=1 Tax=Ciona savignyi TaxID=51511 RepID=H2YLH4_CIOSA